MDTQKKSWINRHPVLTTLGVLVVLIFIGMSGEEKTSTTPPVEPAPQATERSTSKEQAQVELDALMATSKKAGLVTSYEFSDKATEVYVGKVWYTQTVQFKKDFIAKVGMLKKAITGYSHFEVKDAYSNEKVGEIEAFSQSVEVYK